MGQGIWVGSGQAGQRRSASAACTAHSGPHARGMTAQFAIDTVRGIPVVPALYVAERRGSWYCMAGTDTSDAMLTGCLVQRERWFITNQVSFCNKSFITMAGTWQAVDLSRHLAGGDECAVPLSLTASGWDIPRFTPREVAHLQLAMLPSVSHNKERRCKTTKPPCYGSPGC